MLLYNIGSWSASDFISEEPGMMLYYIGTLPAGVLIPLERVSILLYNTGSSSAGDFIPDELGQYVVI